MKQINHHIRSYQSILISGAAGTGKTMLVKQILKSYQANEILYAPTFLASMSLTPLIKLAVFDEGITLDSIENLLLYMSNFKIAHPSRVLSSSGLQFLITTQIPMDKIPARLKKHFICIDLNFIHSFIRQSYSL